MIVYGAPQGKARPRFRSCGKFVQTYTPKNTMKYETQIKNEYYLQDGRYYNEEPLCIIIVAYYEIPKSWSKKKRDLAFCNQLKPMVKPDLDNVIKVVLDALNKVAYADDKQICRIVAEKKYSIMPRLEIELKEMKI